MSIAELPTAGPVEKWSDDGPLYEVVDGVRVELPMSAENDFLANELHLELGAFARAKALGRAVHEILFDLPLKNRDRNRRPDVAFVSFQSWPADRPIPAVVNAWPVAPDLAVEFISPTELVSDLMDKLVDYFEAGVRRVWLVYPRSRVVQIYDSLFDTKGYRDTDELDGGDIVPGFRIKVSALLPMHGESTNR